MKKSKPAPKNYYRQIDNAIKSYEECKPSHEFKIEWICDRIAWCWKFRHITEEQMEELCDRIIEVMDLRRIT